MFFRPQFGPPIMMIKYRSSSRNQALPYRPFGWSPQIPKMQPQTLGHRYLGDPVFGVAAAEPTKTRTGTEHIHTWVPAVICKNSAAGNICSDAGRLAWEVTSGWCVTSLTLYTTVVGPISLPNKNVKRCSVWEIGFLLSCGAAASWFVKFYKPESFRNEKWAV